MSKTYVIGFLKLMRLQIEQALEALYDYEYVDLEKFYNDSYNSKLLEKFDAGDDIVNVELYTELQNFLDFETNYNLKVSDMLS
jgi:hypothetical protein